MMAKCGWFVLIIVKRFLPVAPVRQRVCYWTASSVSVEQSGNCRKRLMGSIAGPVITVRWTSTAVLPVAKVGLCLPAYWAILAWIIVVSTAKKAGIAAKK